MGLNTANLKISKKVKIKSALDPYILKHYAFATSTLFLGLGIYYIIGLKMETVSSAVHLMTVQAFSLTLFILVLISSLVGMAFHHLVSSEQRARNTFAFIFALGLLKFVGGILVFNMFAW